MQEGRKVELGDEGLEADALDAEALGVLQKILLVILRREDLLGAGVRHEAAQQVEVRGRGPGSVRPALFEFAQLEDVAGPGGDQGIEAAAIEDDEDVVVRPPALSVALHACIVTPGGPEVVARRQRRSVEGSGRRRTVLLREEFLWDGRFQSSRRIGDFALMWTHSGLPTVPEPVAGPRASLK